MARTLHESKLDTLADLRAFVEACEVAARAEGHPPETVYLAGCPFATLAEESLSDSSKVLNLYLRP